MKIDKHSIHFLLIYIFPSMVPKKFRRIANLVLICISDILILIYSLKYWGNSYQENAKINLKKIFDENKESAMINQFNMQYELQIHTTTLEMVLDNYAYDRTVKMSIMNFILIAVVTAIQVYYIYITRPKKKLQ